MGKLIHIKPMSNKNKHIFNHVVSVIQFIMIAGMAVISNVLVLFVDVQDNSSEKVGFNIGIDMICLYLCIVLYFGCMKASLKYSDNSITPFLNMIFLVAVTFILNQVFWVAMVVVEPDYYVEVICASMISIINAVIIVMFWRYIKSTLELKGKFVRFVDISALISLVYVTVTTILPCFGSYILIENVGQDAAFDYYDFVNAFNLVFVSVCIIITIIRAKASFNQTIAALSFAFIPLIELILTLDVNYMATEQAAILLSIIFMYVMIFTDRSMMLTSKRTELDTASRIQSSMLPNKSSFYTDDKRFDIYADMAPAREVGGDFYDFFKLDDDRLCMVIADVSGKGVPAALFMAVSKTILADKACMYTSPAKIIEATNDAICKNNEENLFVSMWVGILELTTGRLVAANAGHEYPAVTLQNGGYEIYKDKHGAVVGAMAGMKFRDYEIELSSGSELLVYTDGIVEAIDRGENQYGTARLVDNLDNTIGLTPKETVDSIRDSVFEFATGVEQFDDVTLLSLKYYGND